MSAPYDLAGDGSAVVYEAPCQGQHVQLVMGQGGLIQHNSLMEVSTSKREAGRSGGGGGGQASGAAKLFQQCCRCLGSW